MFLAGCSIFNRPWGKAHDYVDGLRCGMSVGELQGYSERYPRLRISEPDGLEYLVAAKGNTQVLLWFEPTGLVEYQITWVYPLTNFASEPRADLCAR